MTRLHSNFILMFPFCLLLTETEKSFAQTYVEYKHEYFNIIWKIPATHVIKDLDLSSDVWFRSEDDMTILEIYEYYQEEKEDLKREIIKWAGVNFYHQGENNFNGLWSFWGSTSYDEYPDWFCWCIGFLDKEKTNFAIKIYFKKENDLATQIAGDIYKSFRIWK